MFTSKDIETKTVFVVNCLQHERCLRVSNGELLLEENEAGTVKKLTKFPFQKILALFILGHITVTTPLMDKCKKFGVALIVVKPNLRPVFYWFDTAEGNYLLRQRQHRMDKDDLSVARVLVFNKIANQLSCLVKTRKKDDVTKTAVEQCKQALTIVGNIEDYFSLLGLEGSISKSFFEAYFAKFEWRGRRPRTKCDILNSTLDMGYTVLFNFIECFARMFGFDVYVGVYHRLWFKRKSLICDLVEPFRCIIDHAVLLAFNRRQFTENDFEVEKSVYKLKSERVHIYYNVFCSALINRKVDIFKYMQAYYRCFMGDKPIECYPKFVL